MHFHCRMYTVITKGPGASPVCLFLFVCLFTYMKVRHNNTVNETHKVASIVYMSMYDVPKDSYTPWVGLSSSTHTYVYDIVKDEPLHTKNISVSYIPHMLDLWPFLCVFIPVYCVLGCTVRYSIQSRLKVPTKPKLS